MGSDDAGEDAVKSEPPRSLGSAGALVPLASVGPRSGPSPFDDVAVQKLWLATQRHVWRSLAVVAGDKEVSTIEVANKLAKIAWWYRGEPTCVFDLRDLSLRMIEYQLRDVRNQVAHNERVIIALRSVGENPTAVAVANVADAAVLCVRLGSTRTASAQQNIDEIGRGKFIGTIIVKVNGR